MVAKARKKVAWEAGAKNSAILDAATIDPFIRHDDKYRKFTMYLSTSNGCRCVNWLIEDIRANWRSESSVSDKTRRRNNRYDTRPPPWRQSCGRGSRRGPGDATPPGIGDDGTDSLKCCVTKAHKARSSVAKLRARSRSSKLRSFCKRAGTKYDVSFKTENYQLGMKKRERG